MFRLLCWLFGHSWDWMPVDGMMVERCRRCGRVLQIQPKSENLNDM
jgi:hypothetical protein